MKRYETQNYIFNYQTGSTAERDILKIAQIQEYCYGCVRKINKRIRTSIY